jgi:hypothetical protein
VNQAGSQTYSHLVFIGFHWCPFVVEMNRSGLVGLVIGVSLGLGFLVIGHSSQRSTDKVDKQKNPPRCRGGFGLND